MNDSNKTLLTAVSGLLVGALVTYFGMGKLTENIMSSHNELGKLQQKMIQMQTDIDETFSKHETSKEQLEKAMDNIRKLDDQFKSIETVEKKEILDKVGAIQDLNIDPTLLATMAKRIQSIEDSYSTMKFTKEESCHNKCSKTLGSEKDRVCFLTKVKGAFNGGAESTFLHINNENWVLSTTSGGSPTWASARCLIYKN